MMKALNPGIIRKENIQRINKTSLIFILLFLFSGAFLCGNDYTKIIDQFKNGTTASQIIQECRNWLLKNYTSVEYYDILMYYYTIEENSDILIAVMHDSINNIKNNQNKGEIFKKTAELAELKGNLSAAQADYEKAALFLQVPDSYYAIINIATLLYHQGMYTDALSALSNIPGSLENSEIMAKKLSLEGLILYAAGDLKKAQFLLEFVQNKYNQTGYFLTVLDYYIKLLNDLQQNETINKMFTVLKTQYENSPEYFCYFPNKKVFPLIRPNMLFTNSEPLSNPAKSEEQTTKPLLIQTGSFSVKENAEYMILDLEKKGFKAFYIEKIINNEKHYSVIAQMTNDFKNTDSFYQELKNNGFNGFKVTFPNYPETQSE